MSTTNSEAEPDVQIETASWSTQVDDLGNYYSKFIIVLTSSGGHSTMAGATHYFAYGDQEVSIFRTFWFTQTLGESSFSQLGIVEASSDGFTTNYELPRWITDGTLATATTSSSASTTPSQSTKSPRTEETSSPSFKPSLSVGPRATVTLKVSASADPSEREGPNRQKFGAIAGGVVGGAVFFVLIVLVYIVYRRLEKQNDVIAMNSQEDGRVKRMRRKLDSLTIVKRMRKSQSPRPVELPVKGPQNPQYHTAELPTPSVSEQ